LIIPATGKDRLMGRQIFWGEMHDNTYQYEDSPLPFSETLQRAASHLDFYAAAYYTACCAAFQPGGHLAESNKPHDLVLEGWKDPDRLEREWKEVNHCCREANQDGRFVTFPGYEWQGDGSGGDHNVFARQEGLPLFRVDTLAELYACLQGHDALAIPHHTAYCPAVRGRNWNVYDPTLTPFCEIYSMHGSSETDDEWVPLRLNPHMGPGTYPGTWQAALEGGLLIGAICSTDNWGAMPGHFGRGLAAVLADDLSRQSLWDAFTARRVYGVTGDRIELDYTLNGAEMGSQIEMDGPRHIHIAVRGLDELDRIELLRNGRVIATHCHQGTWDHPRPGQRSTYRMRLEAGWGPRQNEMVVPDRQWQGHLHVEGSTMRRSWPCWISPGQSEPRYRNCDCSFEMVSSAENVAERWQNANVIEFEADPEARLTVRLNGLQESGRVCDFARGSREMWFKEECVKMLHDRGGIEPYSPERMDIYHHMAYKAKLHKPLPQAAWSAGLDFVDDTPLSGQCHYRVRVEQRNGQRAWSSPIWVRPESEA
jgi:hypothetical protein